MYSLAGLQQCHSPSVCSFERRGIAFFVVLILVVVRVVVVVFGGTVVVDFLFVVVVGGVLIGVVVVVVVADAIVSVVLAMNRSSSTHPGFVLIMFLVERYKISNSQPNQCGDFLPNYLPSTLYPPSRYRRQEAVDLLLGVHRPAVDPNGNIVHESFKEPLDLDLWTTRLAAPYTTGSTTFGKADSTEAAGEEEGTLDSAAFSAISPARPSLSGRENSWAEKNSSSLFAPFLPTSFPTTVAAAIEEDDDAMASSSSRDGSDSSSRYSSASSFDGEEVLSVGLRDDDGDGDDDAPRSRSVYSRYRRGSQSDLEAEEKKGTRKEERREESAANFSAAGNLLVGGERAGAGSAVERVTGAALTELRMAGPYSVLALTVRTLQIRHFCGCCYFLWQIKKELIS